MSQSPRTSKEMQRHTHTHTHTRARAHTHTHTALETDSEVAYTGSQHELRIVICSTANTDD
jgi:hypothetical protein